MTSAFDPNAFLDAQITETNEKRPLLPIDNPDSDDGLYVTVIGEIKADSGTIGKGERQGQPWVSMIIPHRIQVPASLQAIGLPPELTLTNRAFLDLTPQGGLDNGPGKNRGQKNYREACQMNVAGETFAWRMLEGKVVKIQLEHELYQDVPQERIKNVLAS